MYLSTQSDHACFLVVRVMLKASSRRMKHKTESAVDITSWPVSVFSARSPPCRAQASKRTTLVIGFCAFGLWGRLACKHRDILAARGACCFFLHCSSCFGATQFQHPPGLRAVALVPQHAAPPTTGLKHHADAPPVAYVPLYLRSAGCESDVAVHVHVACACSVMRAIPGRSCTIPRTLQS